MELGIYTFGDIVTDPAAGLKISPLQRMQELLEEAKLADELGLDVFAVGEHHRHEFIVSAPTVLLAAIAAQTKNIKLSSAVTVLSSDDPVRVYEQFATLDLISNGRAEIMAGRGSFIESFPLFGYDLQDYDVLFEEKLELLLRINKNEIVEWEGGLRPAIRGLGVYPRALQEEIPVWIAVGGTPASAIRAAKLHLPLALAIIGGYPQQFVPLIELYKKEAEKNGMDKKDIQVGINTHVFIADDAQKAADIFFPGYATIMRQLGKERGWPPLTRQQYDAMRSPQASLVVGSAQQVVDKILYEYELFGNSRFLAQMAVGYMPHKDMLRSMELFGTVVAEAVRKYAV